VSIDIVRHNGSANSALRSVDVAEMATVFPNLAGRPLALALAGASDDSAVAVSHEAFDSGVFGRTIGRIVGVRAGATHDFSTLLRAVTDACRSAGFDQLLRRTATTERAEVWALGATDFELMDVGVTFARSVAGRIEPPRARNDLAVRHATQDDIEAVAGEMLHLAWGSRYESDPTYSAEQLVELRRQWLWNSHRGRADTVLIGKVDGKVAAFLTCLVDHDRREGSIELVGTLPGFRRIGAASHLLAHAVSYFSERADIVTVRTQATNLAAARLYERAGFTMHASDLTFRRLLQGVAS
jgi:ribosomal protein S18 acetylase RimI-like enzyme